MISTKPRRIAASFLYFFVLSSLWVYTLSAHSSGRNRACTKDRCPRGPRALDEGDSGSENGNLHAMP